MSMVAAGVAAGPEAADVVAVLGVGVAANCEDVAVAPEPEGARVGAIVGEPAAATANESKGIQLRQ